MLDFLSGKKTYILLIVSGILGLLQSFGIVIPEWIWVVDATLMGGAFRAGIEKSGK